MTRTTNIIRTLMAVFALALTVVACSGDDEVLTVAQRQPVISVTDARGFCFQIPDATRQQQGSLTRAVPERYDEDGHPENDNDFRGTVYVIQDSIGIYEVTNGVVTRANVKYVFDGQNWSSANSIPFDLTDTSKEYFAYFPYKKTSPDGAPALNASVGVGLSDTVFFASMVSQWDIPKDQSTYAAYQQADLMTGKGKVEANAQGGKQLAFKMYHRNGLVVLRVGSVKYMLPRYEHSAEYYWYAPLTSECSIGEDNGNYLPCAMPGHVRCIVPINEDVSIDAADGAWGVIANVTRPGHYQRYVIGTTDGAVVGDGAGACYFSPQLGDILYSDGHFEHQDGSYKSASNGCQAIGIVCYLNQGNDEAQTVIDNRPIPEYFRGLVMSVSIGSSPEARSPNRNIYEDTYSNLGQALGNYDGLQRYGLMEAAAEEEPSSVVSNDLNWLNSLANPNSANTPCSPWFLPTAGQVFDALTSWGCDSYVYRDSRVTTSTSLDISWSGRDAFLQKYSRANGSAVSSVSFPVNAYNSENRCWWFDAGGGNGLQIYLGYSNSNYPLSVAFLAF